MKTIKILGIETSCDETGLAIVEASGGIRAPKFRVLKNLVASQVKIHRPFGGVVPNLAKREHIKNLPILLKKLLPSKFYSPRSSSGGAGILNSIDLIAVTVGPGLEPALWTGINFAEELAKQHKKPIVGANHLEGHLYSFLLRRKVGAPTEASELPKIFPAVALIVSGGHTILLYVESFSKWKRLGETRDDAAGECFDKVARMLRLPYPGGPEIEKLSLRQAQGKQPQGTINFPRPMMTQKNYDFSFSGLKTAVLYYLRDKGQGTRDKEENADIAASFQQAAVDVLVAKTRRAAEEYGAESIILSGGVAANKHLRRALKRAAGLTHVNFFVPDFKYNLDNAAMIAAAGYMAHLRSKSRRPGTKSGVGIPTKASGKYKLAAQGNLGI